MYCFVLLAALGAAHCGGKWRDRDRHRDGDRDRHSRPTPRPTPLPEHGNWDEYDAALAAPDEHPERVEQQAASDASALGAVEAEERQANCQRAKMEAAAVAQRREDMVNQQKYDAAWVTSAKTINAELPMAGTGSYGDRTGMCESAYLRTQLKAPFTSNFTVPAEGCYRIEAHAGAAECGFGGKRDVVLNHHHLEGDLEHRQTPGWSSLGIFFFSGDNVPGMVSQQEGLVDAFRVVHVGGFPCSQYTAEAPSYAKLVLAAGLGEEGDEHRAKTAFYDAVAGDFSWARILDISSGKGIVQIDLELIFEEDKAKAEITDAFVSKLCAALPAPASGCAATAEFYIQAKPMRSMGRDGRDRRGDGWSTTSVAVAFVAGAVLMMMMVGQTCWQECKRASRARTWASALTEVCTKYVQDRKQSKSVTVAPKEPEQKHGDYDDETCSTVTPHSTKDMTVEEA